MEPVEERREAAVRKQIWREWVLASVVAFPYLVVAYYFIEVETRIALIMAFVFAAAVFLLRRRWAALARKAKHPNGTQPW